MVYSYLIFFTALLTVCCGILVRANKQLFPQLINIWLGDALYAFMMFYIIAFFFTCRPAKTKGLTALIVCYGIELSQLYQAGWINTIRHTLPGRLILGSGFLWSDLMAYLAGIGAAFCVDILWLSTNKTTP